MFNSSITVSRVLARPIDRLLLALAVLGAGGGPALAQIPQEGAAPPRWIWYPTGKPLAETPAGTCYFRKPMSIKEPGSRLSLDITADNRFVLYLDGKEVVRSDNWRTAKNFQAKLDAGPHILAVAATNEDAGPAGLLIRGGVLPLGQVVPIHTNASWKTTTKVPPGNGWMTFDFDDSAWSQAADLGPLGTDPWKGLVFESGGDASERFKVPAGFKVSMVAAPEVTGSAISFSFDAQGQPCVGVERGPIVRLKDADGDGQYDDRVPITPQITNCQGFSFIKGALYAVGDGPEKAGLYRLTDPDGDGVFEHIALVRASLGPMGEHGPHNVMQGPDGMLYFNCGNHAHLKPPIEPQSPVNIFYEGELLPHYNDSRGHAAGIAAPGGEIYRSADNGKTWERVVAGFRNHYDFAFNREGEIFSFDSDMEWDVGLPWYRPVRVTHGTLGADFGWRTGSADWPPYYFDSLPPTLDIGRGSPTGVTFYQGNQFPAEYNDSFIVCDWSQGRILSVALERAGATYKAKATELVSGQPLNCTDIEVGPDGALYFSTGGRQTQGGLYRVEWAGAKPAAEAVSGGPVYEALAIGSPLSAFSQERLAKLKKEAGDEAWASGLSAIVTRQKKTNSEGRTRALDLLTQFGPAPDEKVLIQLAADKDALVRAKAVQLLGMHNSAAARGALATALADADPFVRRRACESLVRSHGPVPVEKVIPLLADPDRWIRFAARNALEHADLRKSGDALLAAKGTRPLIEGMLLMVRAGKLNDELQADLLGRERRLLAGELAADERLDLLRLIGLTYMLGPRKPDQSPTSARLAPMLLEALPGPEGPIRTETARLLAYVAGPYSPKAVSALLELQQNEPDHATQVHYTYCLRVLKEGWTPREKEQLWDWYETASQWEGGFSYLGYLDYMLHELVQILSPEEQHEYIAQGEKYPFPTRMLVRSIDLNAAPDRIGELGALYARLGRGGSDGSTNELRVAILETIGASRRPASHQVLRAIAEADPPRRDLIARALAQHPLADDLPALVAALDTRDPNTAGIVVAALRKLDATPRESEPLRSLIMLARRTGPSMQSALDELGKKWTPGATPPAGDFAKTLAFWESEYARRYPSGRGLAASPAEVQNTYTLEQLRDRVLQSALMKSASPERGKAVIEKARCLECHKFADKGQGLGPDLTTVTSRFRPAEILESIVEPSKVISDQYKSTTIATTGGQVYNGMPAGAEGDKLLLLLSDGTKLAIPKSEIDDQKESKVSVMPEGLLNALTLQEVADMLAAFNSMPRVAAPSAKP